MHGSRSVGSRCLITSDMVAGLVSDLGLKRQTTSDIRHTKTRLRPRDGVSNVWMDELLDVLSEQGCSHLLNEDGPPSLHELSMQAPYIDNLVLQECHAMAVEEWKTENTRLYHILRGSIDISGPMQDSDLKHFHEHFVHGEARDGRGLYLWATSFKTHTSVSAQSSLIARVESSKLTGGTPSLTALEVHCNGLLNDWVRITGNHVMDPAGFYFRLLRSMSGAPDGSKLSMLHQWLANKVTDADPLLKAPVDLIRKLVDHGETLGLPATGQAINALGIRD